ncbi:hypothetical protein AXW67_25430 [Bradyrhizobium neotropicale]|uniref:Uncharacterized protein n=1 Tax=Bradyrhizobium neotropicale TaxID=1497615 RepID=A0A176YSU8_9BRAD|nr:hypothetical protein AXW67_25430 [Bradyrhizobium neotropicale]
MSFTSNAVWLVWLVGIPSLGLANAYFIWKMRRSLAPGLAQFNGYTDWRIEGRRPSFLRDPSAYSERGKKYRRCAIVVECLFLPWFFGGLLMLAFLHSR